MNTASGTSVGHHQADQHMHHGSPMMRRERRKGTERIFEEIMAENFPNMMKDMKINIQEAQLNQTFKSQNKEKILKAEREKQIITYKGSSIKL